jgi:hypothetical protein
MITNRLQLHLSIATLLLCLFYSCGSNGNFSIEGTVKSKEQGKDGYTAYIHGNDGREYSAVISKVNMAYSLEYKDLSIGEHVKVYGDTIGMGNYTSITVTKIKKR